MFDQLMFIRNGGETRRFHGWPVLRQQTVAEHSFHVAMILHTLYGQSEPGLPAYLVTAALCDDLAEWVTGDPPSPFTVAMEKRMPGFRDNRKKVENEVLNSVALDWDQHLTDEDKRKLKFADYVDGAMYCIRERAMGNQLIGPAFTTFMTYLPKFRASRDSGYFVMESDLIHDLRDAWLEVNGGLGAPPTPAIYEVIANGNG